MNPNYKVSDVMVTSPTTIAKGVSVDKALQLMLDRRLRHLPVHYDGELVGLVTERDLRLIHGFPTACSILVSDVMTREPYCVKADDPLSRVIDRMAKRRYGCAVVVDDFGAVTGLLTATDALQFLADLLLRQPISKVS